jgi:hypothetical protein
LCARVAASIGVNLEDVISIMAMVVVVVIGIFAVRDQFRRSAKINDDFRRRRK